MKSKKLINEEIKRMQIIAGLVKEEYEEEEAMDQEGTEVEEAEGGYMKVGDIASPEWKGLVEFLAKKDGLYTKDLEQYPLESKYEDSAVIHAQGYDIHLEFGDDRTYVDISGSDTLYNYSGYTSENFKKDFGQKEEGSAIGGGGIGEEEALQEDAVDYAWIPGAAAALGIGALMLKAVVGIMKEKGYKGLDGFLKAIKDYRASRSGEDVAPNFEESKALNEYEKHYEVVDGKCYEVNDEGDRRVVNMYYCKMYAENKQTNSDEKE